jgi:hypothetical protein
MVIQLRNRIGDTYEVEVRQLDSGLFELMETPLCLYPLAAFGDVVRLRLVEENTYKLQRVVERPLQHFDFLIPGEYGASRALYEFGDWICARGGQWEGFMLGLLYVHLPSSLARAEVVAELRSRLEAFRDSEERAAILRKGIEETIRERYGTAEHSHRTKAELGDDEVV